MQEPFEPGPGRRVKYLVGGVVIVVTLTVFVVWALARPGATSFYYSPTEVLAAPSGLGPDFRVHAKVVPGSVERDGLASSFDLSDGTTTITVATEVPLPDTLRADSEVVARGSFDGRVFTAVEVVAKCPSKFKAKA